MAVSKRSISLSPFPWLLALDQAELDLGGRGFDGASPQLQDRLNAVVHSFVTGYNEALARPSAELDFLELPSHLRGFAFEGAAMSSTLLDLFTVTRGRRLSDLAEGAGRRYIHLIHVGAGWAYARLRLRPWWGLRFGHPVLRWLAWDGWGFQQAYFHPEQVFGQGRIERAARGPVRAIRDQGVGRALWFYAAAEPARIAGVIGAFPPGRRIDLWAGIGLAASYTGAQSPRVLGALLDAAAGYHDHVAQGAAFAAKAHSLSGAVPKAAAAAIETLTGAVPVDAAAWTDTAFAEAVRGLDTSDTSEVYQRWRCGIRRSWERSRGGVRS